MKKIQIILLLVVAGIFNGCSSDSEGAATPTTPVAPALSAITITTKAPVFSNGNTLMTSGGTLSSLFAGQENCSLGVCYGQAPNPTQLDFVSYSNTAVTLDFTTQSNISFATTYYIRAFVRNSMTNEVKYGNEITVSVPSSITTGIPKNINAVGFSIDVVVDNSLAANEARGICYSTSHNPTVSNQSIQDSTSGAGSFTISRYGSVNGSSPTYYVTPNTVYYLKSFVRINGNYYYGPEVSFRTAGYTGGSGGHVFFDKGETTNGWRYLEAAPTALTGPSPGFATNFYWSNATCGYTFLSNISQAIGTGKENTTIIRNFCNYNNIGATMCNAIPLNAHNDWFLPSIEEMKQLFTLKYSGMVNFSGNHFLTSSQSSDQLCYVLNTATPDGTQLIVPKSNFNSCWQVRRF